MTRSQRENARLRALLAVAVIRLGGELRLTSTEQIAIMEAGLHLGMDNPSHPTVVTAGWGPDPFARGPKK